MTNSEVIQLREEITESIHAELATRNGMNLLTRVSVWAGLLVSLSTLGLLLWRGGALSNTLQRTVSDQALLVSKVAALESSATTGAKEYMAADTARQRETDSRLARLEAAMTDLSQMKADIAVVKVQTASLVNALHEHDAASKKP